MLAAEGFGQLLSIMPDNPVFRVEFARNNHRAQKKAKGAQDDEEEDVLVSERPDDGGD